MPVEFERVKLGSLGGTGYQGVIQTTYDRLVQVFGEPEQSADVLKTRREWHMVFTENIAATIYDWKQRDIPVTEVTEWTVGGMTKDAWVKVVEALEL